MQDTTCFNISGAGSTANPFRIEPILDPDPANLTSCGASGLLSQLPELYRNPPRVRVRRSINQTLPANNVVQYIQYDIADFDVGGWWDEGEDPGKITVPTAGLYSVKWRTNVGAWGGDVRLRAGRGILVKNAIHTVDKDANTTTDPNTGIRLSGAVEIELEEGDTLGVQSLNGDTTDGNSGPDDAGIGNMISARWVAPRAEDA